MKAGIALVFAGSVLFAGCSAGFISKANHETEELIAEIAQTNADLFGYDHNLAGQGHSRTKSLYEDWEVTIPAGWLQHAESEFAASDLPDNLKLECIKVTEIQSDPDFEVLKDLQLDGNAKASLCRKCLDSEAELFWMGILFEINSEEFVYAGTRYAIHDLEDENCSEEKIRQALMTFASHISVTGI